MKRLVKRLLRPVLEIRTTTAVRIACVLTLIALGFMVWSMAVPTPLPVMLAMTVGQGIGTIAFALYIYVVIREIRRERRQRS